MLRLFFLALTAIVIVAVGWVAIPRNTSRPDRQLSGTVTNAPDQNAFVVRNAAPPDRPLPSVPSTPQADPPQPANSATPPQALAQTTTGQSDTPATPDLDALMQRLRAANFDTGGPSAASAPAPPTAVQPQQIAPPSVPAVISPALPATPVPLPASHWTSVTPQGNRWRIMPSASGYTIAIDLGGSRIAEVHVAPAFGHLDSAAVNQRVDYLKQTILQNFPPESASYTFARDGSVSLDN